MARNGPAAILRKLCASSAQALRKLCASSAQALRKLCASSARVPRREHSRFGQGPNFCAKVNIVAQKLIFLHKFYIFVGFCKNQYFLCKNQDVCATINILEHKSTFSATVYIFFKNNGFLKQNMILCKSCDFEAKVIYFSRLAQARARFAQAFAQGQSFSNAV